MGRRRKECEFLIPAQPAIYYRLQEFERVNLNAMYPMTYFDLFL